MPDNFLQCKNSALSKSDKSSIGKWDKKIVKLCERINKSENYYTTSSCAGRIVLVFDKSERDNVFVKVWHDRILLKELKEVLTDLISPIGQKDFSGIPTTSSAKPKTHPYPATPFAPRNDSLKNPHIFLSQVCSPNKFINKSKKFPGARARGNIIKFKQEPPILHVACKNLESAQKILEKARASGWKRSGIISFDKNKFVVELLSTEKLEFPIIANGNVLVSDDFLKLVVRKANENLVRGWDKIGELREKDLKIS